MFQDSPRFFSRIFVAAAGLALVGLPHEVRADDTSSTSSGTDKGQFNLFNPTPAGQLRPLAIDANDGVVDPTTVDAGHVQVEGSLVDCYTVSQNYEVHPSPVQVLTTHEHLWLRRAIAEVVNKPWFCLFIPPFIIHPTTIRVPSAAPETPADIQASLSGRKSTCGEMTVEPPRLLFRHTFFRSPTVIMAEVLSWAVRTSHSRYVCPTSFLFEVYDGAQYAFDNTDGTVHFGMDNSMSVHKSLDQFDIYTYLNTNLHASPALWYGYAGFGAAYLVTDNHFSFSCGIGFGLNSNAYDYNPRFGLGWRF